MEEATRHTRTEPAISRRNFLRLAGTAAVGAALGACMPLQPGSRTSGTGPVQLVYQDWRTDWFPPMVQQMLEQFHATHPDIRVFYIPDPDNLADRMVSDFQAGTAPDVFQGCCSHFPAWAQQGYCLDLRPYVEADLDQETIDDWDPAQYRAFFLKDGQLYGLPKYHGALALYYNKDLCDRIVQDYPDRSWDHEDYREAMMRLTDDRDDDARTDLWGSTMEISWDRIQVHVNGWGGHLVDPDDPTRCRMAEREALAAMEWLRARMWDNGVMATPRDVRNMTPRQAFISERVAMVEDGSWSLKDILTAADFRIGIAPFPSGPARRVTLATTEGFGIYAGTKHPDAAWELIKFLVSKDYGRAMARANYLQPARASLVDDWIGYIRDEFPEKTREMDLAAFAEGHIEGYSVTSETFANMADARKIANDAWQRIFVLGDAPVDYMRQVCQQIEATQGSSHKLGGGVCAGAGLPEVARRPHTPQLPPIY